MSFLRGRWYKKYINCPEDKRDYDILRRGYMQSHEKIASEYCEKFCVPDLTDEEKEEILAYWEQFGIGIYDFSWHRMYYFVTGRHDPRFVPDMVAGLVLYEYYNDRVYENTWRDKNMFERLLPGVPFPKTYGKCIRNRLFLPNGEYLERDVCGEEQFANVVWNNLKISGKQHIIIKNTRDTGFGKGVSKYPIASKDDVLAAIHAWDGCKNFIVQECVHQHSALASFNESSTNMMRICSWRHGTEVDILFAAVRAGIPGSVTDVSFVDGIEMVNIVGITSDGYFSEKMLDQYGRVIKELPRGVAVPSWDKIKRIIKENHLLIDNFDIIGWDFTIDDAGEPKCFEWNIQWPGTVFYQYANGPLYGENTERIFDFLKNEENQKNYIPYYMRAKK